MKEKHNDEEYTYYKVIPKTFKDSVIDKAQDVVGTALDYATPALNIANKLSTLSIGPFLRNAFMNDPRAGKVEREKARIKSVSAQEQLDKIKKVWMQPLNTSLDEIDWYNGGILETPTDKEYEKMGPIKSTLYDSANLATEVATNPFTFISMGSNAISNLLAKGSVKGASKVLPKTIVKKAPKVVKKAANKIMAKKVTPRILTPKQVANISMQAGFWNAPIQLGLDKLYSTNPDYEQVEISKQEYDKLNK